MFARPPANPSHASSGSSDLGGNGFLLLCWAVCSCSVAIPGLRRGKREGQIAEGRIAAVCLVIPDRERVYWCINKATERTAWLGWLSTVLGSISVS